MICFIDLRGQINDDNDPCFAFYDTVHDHFLMANGEDTFDSVSDFIDYAQVGDWEQGLIDRCIALIPLNYFDTKLDDEVIELPSKQLQQTGSFARTHVPTRSQKIGELVPELARDAAAGLLKGIARIVRYRKTNETSTQHALTRIMINDTPSVVIISATVIPLEYLDIYGQNFADDLTKLCAQMDAKNEREGRRRCDCENDLCTRHVAGDCKKPVTIFESRLCDDCAQVMPKEYLK